MTPNLEAAEENDERGMVVRAVDLHFVWYW